MLLFQKLGNIVLAVEQVGEYICVEMSSLFRYSVADTPFSVPSNVATEELCDLINGLLNSGTRSSATSGCRHVTVKLGENVIGIFICFSTTFQLHHVTFNSNYSLQMIDKIYYAAFVKFVCHCPLCSVMCRN